MAGDYIKFNTHKCAYFLLKVKLYGGCQILMFTNGAICH